MNEDTNLVPLQSPTLTYQMSEIWKFRCYASDKFSFTSPIRRYATATSHRRLLDYQDGKSIVLPLLNGGKLKLLRSPLPPNHRSSIPSTICFV